MIRRAARLETLLAAKRELHPELAAPLTWNALQAVCRRERITLALADLPREHPAQLIPFYDRWTILVARDVGPRDRLRLAAHELGHLWAHHDAQHERWELVFQSSPSAPSGPQEREADGVALLLVDGRAFFPPKPRRAPLTAVRAVQLLDDPYSPTARRNPVAIGRRDPPYGGSNAKDSRLAAALRRAKRVNWGPVPSPYRTAIG